LTHHWYAQAYASVGAGTTNGSEVVETLPSSIYTDDAASDESAWVINWTYYEDSDSGDYSYNGSWEFGYFEGVWPYSISHPLYSSPTLYQTVDAGNTGTVLLTDLPLANQIQFSIANVDTNCPTRLAYNVTTGSSAYSSTACGPGGSSGTAWVVPASTRQDFLRGKSLILVSTIQRHGWAVI
jgi:hypothetical protein